MLRGCMLLKRCLFLARFLEAPTQSVVQGTHRVAWELMLLRSVR